VDPQLGRGHSAQDFESSNPPFHDPFKRAAPANVEHGEYPGIGFEKVDGNAIGGCHREKHTGSVRGQSVCIARYAHTRNGRRIDHDHARSVHLAADDARAASKSMRQRIEPF
jgi:hypothetical protein